MEDRFSTLQKGDVLCCKVIQDYNRNVVLISVRRNNHVMKWPSGDRLCYRFPIPSLMFEGAAVKEHDLDNNMLDQICKMLAASAGLHPLPVAKREERKQGVVVVYEVELTQLTSFRA